MGREEEYTVSFDISENGEVTLAVVMSKVRKTIAGSSRTYEELKCVNRIVGVQAKELYKKLTKKEEAAPNFFENRTHSGLLDV